MHSWTLCNTCEKSAYASTEIQIKINVFLNNYAFQKKDSTLIEALRLDNARLGEENRTLKQKLQDAEILKAF